MSADKTKPCGKERRAAKELLGEVRAGAPTAIERVQAVIREFSPDRFSLMTAQHVVAVERGFRSWADMLARCR